MENRRHTSGLTQERLRALLSYDPTTGEFRWQRQPEGCRRPLVGEIAGTVLPCGHRQIRFGKLKYLASHLAHLYVLGTLPTGMMDHKDLDPGNDRWSNLRPATRQQNSANRSAYRNNRSGAKGVCFREERARPWIASIRVAGKLITLGSFTTKEDASDAYLQSAKSAFGEFARAA